MHLAQRDLFWGMDIEFIKKVTKLGVNISCKQGDRLFEIGDQADHFYLLLKGKVVMERGVDKLYTAEKAGEIFGWSALIERGDFAAAAKCVVDTELLRFDREPFFQLLDEAPESKAVLFEHLAKMLGRQLLDVYISITC